MKNYLVKFSCNWADEFDTESFSVFKEEEWKQLQFDIKAQEYPVYKGFGTNEGWDFENAEQILSCLTATEITNKEAAIFKKHFSNWMNRCNFGMIDIDYLAE